MSTKLQDLTTEALTLPTDERIELARRLWDSIEEGWERLDSEESERLAVQEALRRDAEMSSGLVKGIPHEEVMAKARRTIGCK